MNRYLMGIKRYFSVEETFEIDAENKKDALEKALNSQIIKYSSENMNVDTLRVIKKINKNK